MYNTVTDIREYFKQQLYDENFTVDRSGAKTIELLGASFIADEQAIFGEVNWDYVNDEIRWYEFESTNINDLKTPPPKAWQLTANSYGEINSNYGHLVYSPKYYEQYEHALEELLNNRDTRRASMIYTRPSIWIEATENGKNDFICTNAVTYYVRDGLMHCVVQMRSNDVVYGYKNDRAWQAYLLARLVNDYNASDETMFDEDVLPGTIFWQVQNLHVYERHFDLVV